MKAQVVCKLSWPSSTVGKLPHLRECRHFTVRIHLKDSIKSQEIGSRHKSETERFRGLPTVKCCQIPGVSKGRDLLEIEKSEKPEGLKVLELPGLAEVGSFYRSKVPTGRQFLEAGTCERPSPKGPELNLGGRGLLKAGSYPKPEVYRVCLRLVA
ncbi:hypothetical protein J6590_052749 [Homalodisca vitripennis]|nr:hypothetical protein J6590_052749 [Homalodisca vitripennis]